MRVFLCDLCIIMHNLTWFTDHSCIFPMTTVVDTDSIVRAIIEAGLTPCTTHIIQKDWSNSRVKNVADNIDLYCICNQNETLSYDQLWDEWILYCQPVMFLLISVTNIQMFLQL